MGLLSDPEAASGKWINSIKKYHYPLCFVLCAGSVVWFVMLGNNEFNNKTYFSENALLPGLVKSVFNQDAAARRYFTEYTEELQDKYRERDDIPIPWLVGKLSQLNLEVYIHNFTLNYPLGKGQTFHGHNVYAILRAARSASVEAIVLSVPFRPHSSPHKSTAAGIAILLAMAKYARPQTYWAKDLIFLVTEHEQLGMQAWLEAYHGTEQTSGTFQTSLGSFWKSDYNKIFGLPYLDTLNTGKCLNSGNLKGRSGAIQAAINLEFSKTVAKYIEVKVEGLNGQLPNLDLVNLIHKLCENNGIHHSFKNSYSWVKNRNERAQLIASFWTLLGMASTQISGVPNGNHGLFHRFGIEAVTLEGKYPDDPSGPAPMVHTLSQFDFGQLGYMLEGVLRSLNNLLERFHQSFFFYLLAGIDRFVSIGQYMPCLCFLCGALLIRALAIWFMMGENKIDGATGEEVKRCGYDAVAVGSNFMIIHAFGFAAMKAPLLITRIGAMQFGLPTEVSLLGGLAIVSLSGAVLAPFILKYFFNGKLSQDALKLTTVLTLTELSTACLVIGMNNFPLGLLIALIYSPFALTIAFAQGKPGVLRRLWMKLQNALCIILHPLLLITNVMIVYSYALHSDETFYSVCLRGIKAVQHAVVFSVVDSMIYGNWLFNVSACLLLPIWSLLWQLVTAKVDCERS